MLVSGRIRHLYCFIMSESCVTTYEFLMEILEEEENRVRIQKKRLAEDDTHEETAAEKKSRSIVSSYDLKQTH